MIETFKRAAVMLTAASALGGGLVAAVPSVASATCSTDTTITAGVYYYNGSSCTTFLDRISGDAITYSDNLGLWVPNMEDKISSVLITKANSNGQIRTYLYDSWGRTGGMIGLTNVSTTANKSFNLVNFGDGGSTWDNKPRSLCQYRDTTGGNC